MSNYNAIFTMHKGNGLSVLVITVNHLSTCLSKKAVFYRRTKSDDFFQKCSSSVSTTKSD